MKRMRSKLCIALVTTVMLGLSVDACAATCNRKAQSHQAKASNIYLMLREFRQIPSQEDEEFVLCMTEEKEDKEDIQNRIRKLKGEKRNLEAQQAQERAKAVEQQQREQQIANQRAQEQAAREARAESRVVSIQGPTTGYDSYYLGRVTSEDVIIIEPLKGRYSRVGITVDGLTGYTDALRPSFLPGERVPQGRMGGTGAAFNTDGQVPIKVSQTGGSGGPPGRLGNALLNFVSPDNMQIRVTILCVHVPNSVPCKDRDQPSSVTSTATNPPLAAPVAKNKSNDELPTSDPAFSLSTVKVDPSAVTITSGGFAGLKVGHTTQDARLFFEREIVAIGGCGSNPRWTTHSPQGLTNVTLASSSGRLVAFRVASDKYQTRSGLKVGLPESRLLELVGNDPTLERKNTADNQTMYTLGRQSPTSMRIFVKNAQITVLIFGSSRAVDNFLLAC